MALSLSQKDTLTTNSTFLGRVRQAVRQRAKFILALGGDATSAQKDWAGNAFQTGLRSNQIAADLAPELVCDPAIANSSTGDGSDVTDANLQTAVDTIAEKYR